MVKDIYKVEKLHSLLREDFMSFGELAFHELNPDRQFSHNWHLDKIAEVLMACMRGEKKRVIINLPPRSLKSVLTTVAFPAFVLGHDPSREIIAASYGQELSDKLARDCLKIMQSQFYKNIFPKTRIRRAAFDDFLTTRGGGRNATSVGGAMTGRGADIIIVDDPLKAEDALSANQRAQVNNWFSSTLLSRLNDKQNGSIIVVMQRLHLDDLTGFLLEQKGWEVISFPAIAEQREEHAIETPYGSYTVVREEGEALHPERESLETLLFLRQSLGNYNFSSQYQQNPIPVDGNIIKVKWFKEYAEKPGFDRIIQSWDTASKAGELNDYSVCITAGVRDKEVYILDVLREKLEFPALKAKAIELYKLHNPDKVIIEDKGSGIQLIQELQNAGYYRATAFKPEKEKQIRLSNQSCRFSAGLVFLPAEDVHWKTDFIRELTVFPGTKHDDQVDAISQLLEWLSNDESEGPAFRSIEFF